MDGTFPPYVTTNYERKLDEMLRLTRYDAVFGGKACLLWLSGEIFKSDNSMRHAEHTCEPLQSILG
jgi:hypothetical protein